MHRARYVPVRAYELARMSVPVTGFTVRRAAPTEVDAVLRSFGPTPPSLAREASVVYGAFGQPGDVPLGALIVQPTVDASAQFQIAVRTEYRRKGVGTRLVEHLLADARRFGTSSLRLAALVHQDEPAANAFCRKVGLTPERSFATYRASLADQILPTAIPSAERFRRRHAGDPRTRVVALEQIPAEQIARFFADHYAGFYDHRLEQLRRGVYDASISPAVLIGRELVAAGLYQSQPGNRVIYLDLKLVHPRHRSGPLAMVLAEQMCRLSLARGFTDVVFEGDAQHDAFATGYARRCGCEPLWYRYRYAIQLPAGST